MKLEYVLVLLSLITVAKSHDIWYILRMLWYIFEHFQSDSAMTLSSVILHPHFHIIKLSAIECVPFRHIIKGLCVLVIILVEVSELSG